ncbi:MAG: hypothetical protein ABI053_04725 [Lacisediminihabitans sp.]
MNDPIAALHETFAAAANELAAARAKDELLAELAQRRRLLTLVRPPVMVPLGRVWRLGVFLLGHDATVYATASLTRVTDTGRPTFQSAAVEKRRAYRVTAMRSGLPKGEAVNFDTTVIELDAAQLRASTGPLFLRGDKPFVRWSLSQSDDSALALDSYLRDRVSLLVDPPEGA